VGITALEGNLFPFHRVIYSVPLVFLDVVFLEEPEKSLSDPLTRRFNVGKQQPDMIRGTLDMLILKILSLEPLHGWGICERIQLVSEDDLQVNQGSLYPALHKLTQEGWIKSYWDLTENNRKARYYRLTRAGAKQLKVETAHWDRLATAVARVMAIS